MFSKIISRLKITKPGKKIQKIYRNCVYSYFLNKKIKYGLYKGTERDKKIIISLTSFPARYKTLALSIKTLLLQSVKPDMIILYLGKDTSKAELPQNILEMQKYGLTIKDGYEDVRPHKKYLYAMQEYPEDIIITVDDDLMYSKNMVETLIKSYKKYPGSVSARRVHQMLSDKNGLLPYLKWNFTYTCEKKPSYAMLSTNGAGSLFPPHSLPKAAFSLDNIRNYCLNADDIWLKFMLLKNNIPVVWVPSSHSMPYIIPHTQEGALSRSNNGKSQNDSYIEKLTDIYNVNLAEYGEKI